MQESCHRIDGNSFETIANVLPYTRNGLNVPQATYLTKLLLVMKGSRPTDPGTGGRTPAL